MSWRKRAPGQRSGLSRRYTPWHPLLARTLTPLIPQGGRLLSEVPLNVEPFRIDIAIECDHVTKHESAPCLRSIFDRLNSKRTLIEFKSPLDDLDGTTPQSMLARAHGYELKERISDATSVTLMAIADHLSAPFRKKIVNYGGNLTEEEFGVWRVDNLAFQVYVIEAGVVGRRAGERPLALFSRQSADEVRALASATRGWERIYFFYIRDQLDELNMRPEIMALEDHPFFQRSEEEMLRDFMASFSIEDRLEGISVEERLRGLPPEERLRGLPPEELLRALQKNLTPELKEIIRKRLADTDD